MSEYNQLSYVLMWDVTDHSTIESQVDAYRQAMAWPGFPVNPISPNPINVNLEQISGGVTRANNPPLGGGRTRRGGPPKYVSLSNYNNIP